MVSHELRVPLTSIKGSTAAVLGGARHFAPAETREFFRIVDDQADRMRGLIADLLDAGRIDTGTLSVSPEPTEVALLVDRARTTFLSGGGRHTVTIDLPPDLPPDLPRVMADRQRVVQVLKVRVTDLPDWRFARRDSSGPGMARRHQGASRHRTCAHRRAAHPRARRTGPESPDYPDILLHEIGRPAGCAGPDRQHIQATAGPQQFAATGKTRQCLTR